MSELYGWHAGIRRAKLRNALERWYLLVVPESNITPAEATVRLHCRRLDENRARAAQRKSGEMSEVPIGGNPG